MVDLVNATLTVKSVERDFSNPEIICHVMDQTLDLPLNSTYFIGENGERYDWHLRYKRKGDKPGKVVYAVCVSQEHT